MSRVIAVSGGWTTWLISESSQPTMREVVGDREAHLLGDAEPRHREEVAVEDDRGRRLGRREQLPRRACAALRRCSRSTTTSASSPSSRRPRSRSALDPLLGVDELGRRPRRGRSGGGRAPRGTGPPRSTTVASSCQTAGRARVLDAGRRPRRPAGRAARARRRAGRRRAGRRRARRRRGARRTSGGRPRSPPRRSRTSWSVSAIERVESSRSTPAMNSMKNGSSAIVRAGRASTSPQASARAAESARAARFGYQPSSSRDREDALAGVVGDARPAVQRVRDGALGHARALGDVLDRDPARLGCRCSPISPLAMPPSSSLNRLSNLQFLVASALLACTGSASDAFLTG